MWKSFAVRTFCLVTSLAASLSLSAASKSKVNWFTPAFPAVPKVVVPAGSGNEVSKEIEFPALPVKEGMTAVLYFNGRLEASKVGGWNNMAGLEVNGKTLDGIVATGTPRVLGRGEFVETTHPRESVVPYWKGNRFFLLFAPETAEKAEERIISAREMAYEYYIDISDVVNYLEIGIDDRLESKKENKIRFLNYLPRKVADNALLIKNLTIGYVPTAMLGKLTGNTLREVVQQKTFDTLSADGFKLNVLSSGALSLDVAGETAGVDSSFSYVSKPKMKFNELFGGNKKPVGEAALKLSYKKLGDKSGELLIQANEYRIVRNLTVEGNVIRVKDTYKNTTQSDIGIVTKNQLYFSGTMPSASWRLNGQTGLTSENAFGSRNPSVYAKHHDAAVLLLLEDTISRTLIDSRAMGNTFTLGSTGMGIAAGKEVTLEWSIYAGAKVDYWDFVNQIREDWKVNMTVPGPYMISAKALPGLELKFASVTPWLDYADGATLTREQYAETVSKKVAELRAKYPGVKLMGLIENNLITFDASKYPWGNELPLTYGDRTNPKTKYAQYISADLSRKLDAVTPFKDSILHDKNGNDMIDNHYIYGKYPFINLMVQPETDNYRFKFYLDQCDFLMDKMGFDGVYIDQYNPNPHDGRSYDRWDGVSVTLNPDGTIASKFYNYAISGAKARMEIVKYIVEKKHGLVLTNGHPTTREEQSSGRLSFCEIEGDSSCNPLPYLDKKPPEVKNQMLTHLTCPVVLGLRPQNYQNRVTDGKDYRARILTKGIITAIHNGVLYYYYGTDQALEGPEAGSYEVSNWMFPFTAVKLREDVLVGKERTLTVVSGSYTVGGNKPPKVGYFNNHGLPQDAGKWKVSGKPGAWTVDVKLDDWNEIAAIVVQD